jgi:hypothetical protein
MPASQTPPRLSPRFARFVASYQTVATLLLNTAVAFVVLNGLAWAGLALADALTRDRNVVEAKYGSAILATVYPGRSEAEVEQLLGETWQLRRAFRPYVQFREEPFTGRFVNVHAAGFRHSAEQAPWPPPAEMYSIFVFGGSTTFAYGLPDAETVPSQMQRLLRDRGHAQVAVYNFGAGAYQSTQERIFFGELLASGVRPDMAVFIDGLNDFAFPHVPQDTDLVARALANVGVGGLERLKQLAGAIPLVRLVRALLPAAPEPVSTVSDPQSGTDAVSIRYLSNVAQTGAAARAAGVVPVFVWQPTPFYRFDATSHPFKDDGVNRHAADGYARMRTLVEPQAPDPSFLWAADMQEGLTGPLYVDSVHYSTTMARHVAARIVTHLLDTGLFPRAR